MRRLRNDDRGVAAVLIAIVLVLLIAFAGFAVDVGAMYQERRELRRGADAAALAIAEDCVTGAAVCTEAIGLGTADVYADANADDGFSAVEDLEIDLSPSNPDYTMTVRVDSLAEDESGIGFDMRFMQILGIDSVDVRGSATAAAGYAGEAQGFPIIIEECEFEKALFDQGFPGGSAPEDWITLTFHQGNVADAYDDGSAEDCVPDPAGKDAPGAFGYLYTIDSAICQALITCENGVCSVSGDPGGGSGSPPTPACDADEVYELLIENSPVAVPIYYDVTGQGAGALYYVAGFAAFQVMEYKLGGPKYRYPSKNIDCGDPADTCLRGYFTEGVINEGGFGGANFGTILVRLID
jgi:hypothetical protein